MLGTPGLSDSKHFSVIFITHYCEDGNSKTYPVHRAVDFRRL